MPCFIVNPTSPWLGATPDFLGNSEVKCLFSKQDIAIAEAFQEKSFFQEADSSGLVKLKDSHNYYPNFP